MKVVADTGKQVPTGLDTFLSTARKRKASLSFATNIAAKPPDPFTVVKQPSYAPPDPNAQLLLKRRPTVSTLSSASASKAGGRGSVDCGKHNDQADAALSGDGTVLEKTRYAEIMSKEQPTEPAKKEKEEEEETEKPARRSSGVGFDAYVAAKKATVIELARKNRSLSVSLAREKNERNQLIALVARLRQEIQDISETNEKKLEKEDSKNDTNKTLELENTIACLKRKLECERNAHATTKSEVVQWQRVVALETGIHVSGSPQAFLSTKQTTASGKGAARSNTAPWRGRAQQITVLNAKLKQTKDTVAELQQQLEDQQTLLANTPRKSKFCVKQKCACLQPNLNNNQDELNALKSETNVLRENNANMEAKVKALEAKLRNLQRRTKVVVEKSLHDDVYIAALQAELNTAKQGNIGAQDSAQKPTSSNTPNNVAHVVPPSEREAYETEIKNLTSRLESYANEVDALRSRMTMLRKQSASARPTTRYPANLLEQDSLGDHVSKTMQL